MGFSGHKGEAASDVALVLASKGIWEAGIEHENDMAEDWVIRVNQARELHLQERPARRHVLLQRASDAGQDRDQLHGGGRCQGLRPLPEEPQNPLDLPQVHLRGLAVTIGRMVRQETARGTKGHEGDEGGEDRGWGGEKTRAEDNVTDDSGEEKKVALCDVGALGLGEGPEVAGGVGKEAREGGLELAEALAGSGAGLAVRTVIRAVGDCEEGFHEGLEESGGGSVEWGVEGGDCSGDGGGHKLVAEEGGGGSGRRVGSGGGRE